MLLYNTDTVADAPSLTPLFSSPVGNNNNTRRGLFLFGILGRGCVVVALFLVMGLAMMWIFYVDGTCGHCSNNFAHIHDIQITVPLPNNANLTTQ